MIAVLQRLSSWWHCSASWMAGAKSPARRSADEPAMSTMSSCACCWRRMVMTSTAASTLGRR
ncbi:MAG: hypothetical protein IPI43_32360 [Sandaracinaceae bacterium]|nr:hypothetical protein [Sandaracinaceae bacterium]